MNLLKFWDHHCRALEKLRKEIEGMAERLPAGSAGKRAREAVNRAWSEVSASADELDALVTESVQPLPVKFPWQDKEFVSHWSLYKDYLAEQHGILMKSRMEQARLNTIREYSGNDREVFRKTIDFYMALGTTSLFPVNFETNHASTNQTANDGQRPKITIAIPKI